MTLADSTQSDGDISEAELTPGAKKMYERTQARLAQSRSARRAPRVVSDTRAVVGDVLVHKNGGAEKSPEDVAEPITGLMQDVSNVVQSTTPAPEIPVVPEPIPPVVAPIQPVATEPSVITSPEVILERPSTLSFKQILQIQTCVGIFINQHSDVFQILKDTQETDDYKLVDLVSTATKGDLLQHVDSALKKHFQLEAPLEELLKCVADSLREHSKDSEPLERNPFMYTQPLSFKELRLSLSEEELETMDKNLVWLNGLREKYPLHRKNPIEILQAKALITLYKPENIGRLGLSSVQALTRLISDFRLRDEIPENGHGKSTEQKNNDKVRHYSDFWKDLIQIISLVSEDADPDTAQMSLNFERMRLWKSSLKNERLMIDQLKAQLPRIREQFQSEEQAEMLQREMKKVELAIADARLRALELENKIKALRDHNNAAPLH